MRPFSLLIKPAGPDCNMACPYCFYAGKAGLFGPGPHRMSEIVLERLVRDYLSIPLAVHTFIWQGGEPTLMGLDFFQRVVTLQQQYGRSGYAVSNALQTNGLLLDETWCRFLRDYTFLVGISLDGPKDLHDHYRRDRAGHGTFDRVKAAVDLCREHDVEFNVLVLLNDQNVRHPDILFDFFTGQRIRFLQFIPCVERDPHTGELAKYTVTAEQYGEFLCRVFDRWLAYGPENLSIRLFDSLMSYMIYGRHACCTFHARCDDYIVIEHNGDSYVCDFFVEPEAYLGNSMTCFVGALVDSDTKQQFAQAKREVAPKCFVCRHYAVCRGGCPKDRLGIDGNARSVSYLCEGYRAFFDYALPRLTQISAELIT